MPALVISFRGVDKEKEQQHTTVSSGWMYMRQQLVQVRPGL